MSQARSKGSSASTQSPSPMDLLAPLAPAIQKLEKFLEQQCELFEPGVAACARYVVGNQGKRLRPALALFSANAQSSTPLGSVSEPILRLCAIVELVHIATLVHDDIMDGAELRRSRLTAGAKWGNEISVLLGDCLFAHALTLAASFPTPWICRRVAETTNIVCSGEILQTQRRFDLKLNETDYLKMIEMKTGSLFAVACELSGHLSEATPQQCTKFYEFGRLLGIAYQIFDDCLDLFGNEQEVGKSLGTDLQKGKLTLPVILLLQQTKTNETSLISSILLNEHVNSQAMLVEFIRRYDTLKQAVNRARGLLQEASRQLDFLSPNPGRLSLEQLVLYLDTQLQKLS
jgi:octaprenyl-diphosphate synthase